MRRSAILLASIACIEPAVHFTSFGIIRFAARFFLSRLIRLRFKQGCGLCIQLLHPLTTLMNAFRLLAFIEFLVSPKHGNYAQPLISRVGGTDGVKAIEFHNPRQRFSQ